MVQKTVELLRPLYEELKREVFSCDYVQADETTVPVINKESTGPTRNTCGW